MSLHYLVKCLCSKIAITRSWVKRTSMQDSVNQYRCSKIFTKWCSHHFCSLMKRYLQLPCALKKTQDDQLYAYLSARKKDVIKRVLTQLTLSHWRHQSASNKWLTLHQFDTCWSQSQGYWWILIIMCCRMTNYELLRWLVEMQSGYVGHNRTVHSSASDHGTSFHSVAHVACVTFSHSITHVAQLFP